MKIIKEFRNNLLILNYTAFNYKKMKTTTSLVILFLFFFWSGSNNTYAQSANDTVIFNTLGKFDFNFTYSGYTPLIDRLGRPYVYLDTKELYNASKPGLRAALQQLELQDQLVGPWTPLVTWRQEQQSDNSSRQWSRTG